MTVNEKTTITVDKKTADKLHSLKRKLYLSSMDELVGRFFKLINKFKLFKEMESLK